MKHQSIFALAGVLFVASFARAQTMSLREVLRKAEISSPRLRAANYREQAARQGIDIQKSRHLPDLNAAAIASTGDPGSFSFLDVDGNISAANRVGEGAALILKQDIYDFGRTSSAISAAEAQRDYEYRRTAITRSQVDEQAMLTYVGCSFLREEVTNSEFVAEQAKILARETGSFVKSGQRSIVERYLVDAQVEEAKTRIEEFKERVKIVQNRLAIELGEGPTASVQCSPLSELETEFAALEKSPGANPALEAQKVRVHLTETQVDFAKAQTRPLFVGQLSGGYFDNNNLRDKMNYGAGIGITVPLFTGFRLEAGIDQALARLSAERSMMAEVTQDVDRANSEYDEQIKSLGVRLAFLRNEEKLAKKVFDLAHGRYKSLQGNMVDLREAIRNMTRVSQSTDEATRDLLLARGRKTLLNGTDPGR